jgi:4a-hydroxytetrahydrobiopterin dehydratase
MPALTTEQIDQNLKAFPGWSRQKQTLHRTYKFESFLMSIAFVRRIAKRAEKIQHHPDIDIRYDRVTLTLSTHDEGGVTDKDFTLAEQCDEVFAKFAAA